MGAESVGKGELIVLGGGDAVAVSGKATRSRLILAAGKPIAAPVARYGRF